MSRSSIESVEKLQQIFADNNKRYKKLLQSALPPVLPSFGIFVEDILAWFNANPNTLGNGDIINFSKQFKLGDEVTSIFQYFTTPWTFRVEKSIEDFIKKYDA
jgi:hypothetical protein